MNPSSRVYGLAVVQILSEWHDVNRREAILSRECDEHATGVV
jgi:hypothetical protein